MSKNQHKVDYVGTYSDHMGEVGTFFNNNKDKKGVKARFSGFYYGHGSIKGLLGTVGNDLYPSVFDRATFNNNDHNDLTCPSCGAKLNLVEAKKGSKKTSNKKTSKNNKTDKNYGKLSNKKSAQKFIKLLDAVQDGSLDQQDDNDWKKLCEMVKSIK